MTHFGYRIHRDQSIGKLYLLHKEFGVLVYKNVS
jgi:hypothetical protein